MDQRQYFVERYERFRVRIEKSLNVYRQTTPFIMLHYVPVSAFDLSSEYPIIENRYSMSLMYWEG